MTPPGFVELIDPWGRPFLVRPDAVEHITGAADPSDRAGDLIDRHPLHPYRRATLRSGVTVYLADHSFRTLIS